MIKSKAAVLMLSITHSTSNMVLLRQIFTLMNTYANQLSCKQ